MTRTRAATLVMVDRDGTVLGQLGPVAVDLPWWQEAGPIVDAMAALGLDDAVVLRLLNAVPDADEPMGGQVTYLVEVGSDTAGRAGLTLQPWDGVIAEDPLRHPWAQVGGPRADLAWVADQVEVTGSPRQHRTWNLSSIWSIPTPDGTAWLKCLPAFFRHEIAVLDVLRDLPVPQLLAAEGHRCLMASLPGEDGYEADEDEQIAMTTTLVDIQNESAGRIDALVHAGVPDLRTPQLIAELAGLVDRLAPSNGPLSELIEQLPDRLGGAAEIMPDTLVHGDPHGGNCRRGTEPPIWFDWGDSFIGNPLLDIAATHRMSPAAVTRWLDRWNEVVPGADSHGAWRQLEPVAMLRMAWVYQRFLDNIEASEQIYHCDDVPQIVQDVTAFMTAET
jgi:hypothetical protein